MAVLEGLDPLQVLFEKDAVDPLKVGDHEQGEGEASSHEHGYPEDQGLDVPARVAHSGEDEESDEGDGCADEKDKPRSPKITCGRNMM